MDDLPPRFRPQPLITSFDLRLGGKILVADGRNKMVEFGSKGLVVDDVAHFEGPVAGCWSADPSCFQNFVVELDVGCQIPMLGDVLDILADTSVRGI